MEKSSTPVKTLSHKDLWPLLAQNGVDAYLVPSSDEHLNEYLPEAHKRREFLTGFTGSAGDALALSETLVKNLDEKPVWVFVDSRYYEQADLEVDSNTVTVSKVGLDGHPRVSDKLLQLAQVMKLKNNKAASKPEKKELIKNSSNTVSSKNATLIVGFDPFTISQQMIHELEKQCQPAGIQLLPIASNLIDQAWGKNRPKLATSEVYAISSDYTGLDTSTKINRLQQQLLEANCDLMPLTKLDQIAWLLNWRGQDIPYNPVFLSYVIAFTDKILLFCDESRITPEALNSLPAQVQLRPYRDYEKTLRSEGRSKRIFIDPKHTTYGTLYTLQLVKASIVQGDNPVETDKSIKNEIELRWMREAHLKSARGKIKALHWLDTQLSTGKTISEKAFADQLEAFYTEEKDFKGLSFNTIAGAGTNSSIVHYGTPSESTFLTEGELFLIDSGVQYLGGTTDDTRTIIIGKATQLQKERFTDVLKAHINCARQIFPKGTEGARLDGITRATLWQEKLDYGHGTGHGVGAFLNVHEGPCGIHKLASKPLVPGNVVSIEPGYYEPGWGGIRCENLYVVVEDSPGWHRFETLTLIPFSTQLIDKTRLTLDHLNWLENYHQQVLNVIGPTLPQDIQNWLQKSTQL